jgi:hypothetical protein
MKEIFLVLVINWIIYTHRSSDGKSANNLAYTVPNIRNTFVRTVFKYQNDLEDYYSKSIAVERPFYSPLAKWAGGIYLDQQFRKIYRLQI